MVQLIEEPAGLTCLNQNRIVSGSRRQQYNARTVSAIHPNLGAAGDPEETRMVVRVAESVRARDRLPVRIGADVDHAGTAEVDILRTERNGIEVIADRQ